MWAMIVKEFRQVRRDRRTLAMMIVLPVLLLVVLGYAASFDVKTITVAAAGAQADVVAAGLRAPFDVTRTASGQGRSWAQMEQRGASQPGGLAVTPTVTVLYNPGLTTSDIMIPGLCGVVLVFVGTIITSLGVVRERQTGTLEQLAVMPLRPRDVYLGKIVPYFLVAIVDLAIVLSVGIAIFGVPFRGSPAVFGLGALLFLFVTLGVGVLISSVSQNQGQAIQLAVMTLLPQVLLSGLIFPLSSIVAGVRWIAYLLPLTYFNEISRGVMLRAEPIGALWQPFAFLTLLGAVIVTLASLRFRRYLAPARSRRAA